MQSSIDFAAVLTTEPTEGVPADFVSALSAEQGCDICHELHASVYELRCQTCAAAICPDCARTYADTGMACVVCFARHPRAVAAPRGRSTSTTAIEARSAATLTEALVLLAGRKASVQPILRALSVADPMLRAMRQAIARLRIALGERTSAMARLRAAPLRARWTGVARPLGEALARTSRRALTQSSRALQRSSHAGRYAYERAARGGARALVLSRHGSQLALAASRRLGRTTYQATARGGASARALAQRVSKRAVALSVRANRHGARALARTRGHLVDASRVGLARAGVLSRRGRELGQRGAVAAAQLVRTTGRSVGRHGARLAVETRRHARAFGRGARRGLARSRAAIDQGLAASRDGTLRTWVALRSLPVRHHAMAALLTMVLLYAVARADQRDA